MDNTYNRHQHDTNDSKLYKAILEFFRSSMFNSAICTKANFKILLFKNSKCLWIKQTGKTTNRVENRKTGLGRAVQG